MVPFLGFNLAETTSAPPPQGRDQAQQKPNWKAPVVEAECEENPAQGKWQEAQRAGNQDSKKHSAERSHGSVFDSKRLPVGVGSSCSYGWKDMWLTKS